jgi:hypothetical protein
MVESNKRRKIIYETGTRNYGNEEATHFYSFFFHQNQKKSSIIGTGTNF